MVVKKKAPKVEAVALDTAKLESLNASLSVDGDSDSRQLAQTLKDCLASTDPVQQIQLVSKTGSMLEQLREDESAPGALLLACLDTLSDVYLSLQAKNPLKRAVASALSNVPDWLQDRTVCSLSSCLSASLSSLGSEHYSHLTDCITSCLDGFPIGICVKLSLFSCLVLQFFQKAISEYLEFNRSLVGRHVAQAQLMQSCLAVVKASMVVVQKCQEVISTNLQETPVTSTLQQSFSGLLQCYTCILTDEEFIQSVQSTAGMAVVLLIKSVMGNGDDTADTVAGLLQCSEKEGNSVPLWLRESCAGLYVKSRPAAVALYLSHGALAMLSWRGSQDEKLLFTYLNIDYKSMSAAKHVKMFQR
uniref:THADA armadillo repeat containing n=1 Tax=Astyanax mexicanus TaxID=7994 RepID=A0A3B1JJ00_ASTMX